MRGFEVRSRVVYDVIDLDKEAANPELDAAVTTAREEGDALKAAADFASKRAQAAAGEPVQP